MCGQHNARATAGDNTGQYTKDTPSPRVEIKIPELNGNRIWAAGFEGMDSTKHSTVTEKFYFVLMLVLR